MITAVSDIFSCFLDAPVRQKGTDKVFGTLTHLDVIRKNKGVLVVHDLPISSHQGLCIERRFTCTTEREKTQKNATLVIQANNNISVFSFTINLACRTIYS